MQSIDTALTFSSRVQLLNASAPLLIDDREQAWLVSCGFVDIFAVAYNNGQAVGRRHFLVRIPSDELFLGLSKDEPDDKTTHQSSHAETGLKLCAVGSLDCQVVPFRQRDLQQISTDDTAYLIDTWVSRLSHVLFNEVTDWPEITARDGAHLSLNPEQSVYGHSERPCWVKADNGHLLFKGATFSHQWFPLTAKTSVSVSESTGLICANSKRLIDEDNISLAIQGFHQHIFYWFLITLQKRDQDLVTETSKREALTDQEIESGFAKLANVVRPLIAAPAQPQQSPVLTACLTVATYLDIDADIDFTETVDDVTDADLLKRALQRLQLRSRTVLLRDDWWKHDSGPLIAQTEEGLPIALLPRQHKKHGSDYDWVNPLTQQQEMVTEDFALSLNAEAQAIYWKLPESATSFWQIVTESTKGIQSDGLWVAGMGIAAAILALLMPIASGLLIEHIIPASSVDLMWQIIIGLVIAAVAATAFDLTKAVALLRIENRIDWRLQAALFDRLLNLPGAFFKHYTSGDLGDRVLGIQIIRQTLSSSVITSLLGTIFSLFSLLLLFYYSWKLALIALVLIFLSVIVTLIWGVSQLRFDRLRISQQGEVEGFVLQVIIGINKLRVAAAQSRALSVWARAFALQKQHFAATQRYQNRHEVFQSVFPVVATLSIFIGVVWVLQNNAKDLQLISLLGSQADSSSLFSVGDFIAFNAAFGQLLAASTAMSLSVTRALVIIPLYERILPILKEEPESGTNRQMLGKVKGDLELSQVSFRYSEGSPLILDELSLHINAGEFVAIVGPSGSGKSTLMRLLIALEKPDRGEIFIDNKAMSTLDIRSLRRQMGVVLQNGRIIGGSVFKNIVGSSQLDVDAAWHAARQVGLAEDIEAMPMGMHTVLMEGANTLSGGQRQRIMLARALVLQPRILLLDEATSALDNRTQAIVTESLQQLNITRIVIAHRFSTIRDTDRIVVLDQGRIVESGDYASLIAESGLFADMAKRQIL